MKKNDKTCKTNEKKMTKLLRNSGHYLKFCNHATQTECLVPKLTAQTLSIKRK